MRLLIPLLVGALVAGPAAASEKIDRAAINRIVDEGMNRSHVMETAAWLTDRIGARLTNSPQMREAERWAQTRFEAWGLKNVRAEGFPFGRGWSLERSDVRMTRPRTLELHAIPVAWTPATPGSVIAPVILAPMSREADFAQWKGKLKGTIVLLTRPDAEPAPLPPSRYSQSDLRGLEVFEQPTHSRAAEARAAMDALFPAKLDAFLASEGAVAGVTKSYRDGGLVRGDAEFFGSRFRVGMTPRVPLLDMAVEDYLRLVRLIAAGAAPTVEIDTAVCWWDDDHQAYNIIGDIPGRDSRADYVMAGAHLDSWIAADGAVDNAAGVAVVMEAARILSALEVAPPRTIRFALWGAEEQGLYGSLAYVERHVASRPPQSNPDAAPVTGWATRFPITLQSDHASLGAYFNIDSGSGKIRGLYAENNLTVAPILREWVEPFASMGASTVATRRTGWTTDHAGFRDVGIPAYRFIQDPLDYISRLHHTSVDTFDHLEPENLRHNAVILAALLLTAADRKQPLPRMPVPAPLRDTDPFAPTEDDP